MCGEIPLAGVAASDEEGEPILLTPLPFWNCGLKFIVTGLAAAPDDGGLLAEGDGTSRDIIVASAWMVPEVLLVGSTDSGEAGGEGGSEVAPAVEDEV